MENLNQVIGEHEYRLFVGSVFHSVSNLVQFDLRPDSRQSVRNILLAIGDIYSITTNNNVT